MTAATMDRKSGLGGSDIAAVIGRDPRRTALDVYREKIGEAPPKEETEAMLWGTLFEDAVAQRYTEVTGRKVRRINTTLRHKEHPWAMAHVDRRVVGTRRILEVKCSSAEGWGEPGTDNIPEHILPQTLHYLAITGAECCDVAALLWGRYGPPRLAVYEVRPDADLIAFLLAEGARFWTGNVLARVPPEPGSNAECLKRWPVAVKGKAVQVTEALALDLADLEEVRAIEDRAKADRNALEYRIKLALRDASTLLDFDGKTVRATWNNKRTRKFNGKRFRAAHPDLWDAFSDNGETRAFCLKRPKTKKTEALTDDNEQDGQDGQDGED